MIRRCDYDVGPRKPTTKVVGVCHLYRDGKFHQNDFARINDGDIIGRISPEATKDIADAQEIVAFINRIINERVL